MSTIRVVWGSATAPTKMASYDGALADAGIENYNLVTVSSVIPADTEVETVGTAADLGPAGNRLTVVQARATTAGPGRVSAALAWAQSEPASSDSEANETGPGLFYETSGETDREDVERRVLEGLEAGQELRDWSFTEPGIRSETAVADSGTYTTAIVVAAYGRSEPIF